MPIYLKLQKEVDRGETMAVVKQYIEVDKEIHTRMKHFWVEMQAKNRKVKLSDVINLLLKRGLDIEEMDKTLGKNNAN